MNQKFSAVCASLALVFGGLIFSAQASFAAGPVTLSIIGNGATVGSSTSCTNATNALCPASDSCLCNISTGSAKTTLAGLANATFAATTVIDLSKTIGAGCDSVDGTVTITSGNHHNTLVLNYVGDACLFANPLSLITTSYAVDGVASTGKFASATGTGLITGSEDPVSGGILGNVSGNIIP